MMIKERVYQGLGIFYFILFFHTSTFQLLDKPWSGVAPSFTPVLAFNFYRALHRVQSHCSFVDFSSSVANSRSRAFRKSICAKEKVPTNLCEYALHGTDLYTHGLEDNLIRHGATAGIRPFGGGILFFRRLALLSQMDLFSESARLAPPSGISGIPLRHRLRALLAERSSFSLGSCSAFIIIVLFLFLLVLPVVSCLLRCFLQFGFSLPTRF